MTEIELVDVGGAAILDGAVNALAGGGTIITFPVLLAVGILAVDANLTNTVALCRGYLLVSASLRSRIPQAIGEHKNRLYRFYSISLTGLLPEEVVQQKYAHN